MFELTLEDYVTWLVNVNVEQLAKSGHYITDKQALCAYVFGLYEEFYDEFTDDMTNVTEAGDVLAYVVLTLASLGLKQDIIVEFLHQIDGVCIGYPQLRETFGEFKRLFRAAETDNFDLQLVVEMFADTLDFVVSQTGFSLKDIATKNYEKLSARLSANDSFGGRGDR